MHKNTSDCRQCVCMCMYVCMYVCVCVCVCNLFLYIIIILIQNMYTAYDIRIMHMRVRTNARTHTRTHTRAVVIENSKTTNQGWWQCLYLILLTIYRNSLTNVFALPASESLLWFSRRYVALAPDVRLPKASFYVDVPHCTIRSRRCRRHQPRSLPRRLTLIAPFVSQSE